MSNGIKTIKFRLWQGVSPVVLSETTDRYTGSFNIELDTYAENLRKNGCGKLSDEKVARHIILNELHWRFNGDCPYTVEIISIEPLENYSVKLQN